MRVNVLFHSYFKELTGCAESPQTLAPGQTIGELMQQLHAQFPKLAVMDKSTLIAVGVDYQDRSHRLSDGDEVSLFPPVQGG